MVHVPLMATLVPLQVLVCEKSEGTVPVIPMAVLPKVNAAAPLLVTVIPFETLVFSGVPANDRLVGARDTVGNATAAPVPVRATDCGLPAALSVAVTVAVRVPIAVGAKVTAILQLKPAARVVGQLL